MLSSPQPQAPSQTCGVGREGKVCTCQSPISPRTPLGGRRPAQEAKVVITQDAQGHALSEARPGAQAPPCPGGPGPSWRDSGSRVQDPEEPPPILLSVVVPPLLSSPPFPRRPRGQSRCHDTAGRWAALAALSAQPPRSEPRWEGSGGSAPARGPDERRDWQKVPIIHPGTWKGL